jgi:hypothetical protein
MSLFHSKTFAIILILFGEMITIYAEMLLARNNFSNPPSFLKVFWQPFLIMVIGGTLLITGYFTGFGAFKNIWIVSVISITSILIIEPTLAYTIFHQLPTKGALIGLILGAFGFISAMFLK